MKKLYVFLGIVIFSGFGCSLRAQVLNVGEFIQEQDQWCWSGSSACVLDYFCATTAQCTIAEFTREVATWHNFGSTDCCVNPGLGCNYWNYNWGCSGSIQDILMHFAGINNPGIATYLLKPEIVTRIQGNMPFIFRWGWTTGGGHFLVGHGLINSNMYYMNPWPGEGLTISDYDWVVSNPDHDWTHTNDISTPSPRPYPVLSLSGPTVVNKGSTGVSYSTPVLTNASSYAWSVRPADAGSLISTGNTALLYLSGSYTGPVYIKVKGSNSCGFGAADSLFVTVLDPNIIVPLSGGNYINIYPVPSNGIIHAECGQVEEGTRLEIVSVTGKSIISFPLMEKKMTINLSDQPKGLYFGRICGNGVTKVISIILQ
jgi:hypothetical protein